MAHQAASNAHFELDEKVILRRPELAKLLGVLASEWANAEMGLSFLFATLLGKYLPHNQRKGPPIHPAGMQIFDAIESLNKRLQLIQDLVDTLLTKKSLVREFKKDIVLLVRKAGGRRNEFIHAYWGVNDEKYPHALMRARGIGDFLIYEESDFNEAISLCIAADNAVAEFENKVRQHLRWKKRPMRKYFSPGDVT